MNLDFWLGAVLMTIMLVVTYGILALAGRLPRHTSRLTDLEGTVRILQRDHVQDQQRIEHLERELAQATAEIKVLKAQLAQYKTSDCEPAERVLLAVIGNEPDLRLDLSALREVENETGIVVTRCFPARFPRFEATLNRYRAAGTPIKYVHFSVHAYAGEGVATNAAALFDDGPISGEQLSGVLNGVEVAFVAGCDAEVLGDLLGVIPTVVTFKEPVRHEQAALATKLFWLGVGKGLAPRVAYREARSRLPAEVAEFLELHQ